MTTLEAVIAAIAPVDEAARTAAQERQLELTKPPTALGRLETVGNQLAAIAGTCPAPVPATPRLVIFAGDHGVVAEGVSPWPQEVTLQMAANIAHGGAGSSVMARSFGVQLRVVDVGMVTPLPADTGVIDARVRPGTASLLTEPAMSLDDARAAIAVGIREAEQAAADGVDLLLPGEVGIGNTTAAAALIAAFTARPAAEVTGRGAGSLDAMLAHKIDVVARAVARHGAVTDPLAALASLGGLEHAAMVGLYLGAAAHHIPVILDGAISCAAALVAVALCPDVAGYLIAGHKGVEPAIGAALEALGQEPLVDLDLRLGEGTGALAAVPAVQAAAAILADMATFDEAAVAGRND